MRLTQKLGNKRLVIIGLGLAIVVFGGVVVGNLFGKGISLSFLRSLAEQKSASPEFRGYIVVLKSEPLTIKGGVEERSRIRAEHEAAKNKIKEVLGFSGRRMASTLLAEWEGVVNGLTLDITTEQAERLKNLPEIKNIYPNVQVKTTLMDSVPLIRASKVWPLDKDGNLCAEENTECLTGQGIKIGIIDTGIDYTHPDLGGCFGPSCKVVDGYDFVNDDTDPMDDHGHGTHVGSISAGKGTLNGVAPDALLVAYKVLNSGGSGYADDIISAIERSTDPNQDGDYSDHLSVINLSLGGYGNPDDPMSTAIDNAFGVGVVAAIAAGNSGPAAETIRSPGTARKAITVGATDKQDQLASFSSRGPVIWIGQDGIERALLKPDVVAPGVGICAAEFDSWLSQRRCLDDKHIAISGTSMAAPHVAGMVALLRQAQPAWSADEIKMAVRNTSVYPAVPIPADINAYGYGRIDALNAVFSPEPPVAAISTNGTIYRQKFAVTGTATSANFVSFSLYYQKFGEPTWNLICTKNVQVTSGRLCPASMDLGDYLLRLEVTGNNTKSVDTTQITVKNQEIIYPYDLLDPKDPREITPSWKDIEIQGSVGGFGFVKYTLEWCSSDPSGNIYEPSCTTSGITLTRNGQFPVGAGKLGTFTPSVVPKPAFYALRLISEYRDEGGSTAYTTSVLTYVETQMQTGWPLSLGSQSQQGLQSNTPAIYVDKGSKQNALWVTKDGKKFIPLSRGTKSTNVGTAGWALSLMRQPTLADVDGDGKKDIVMAYGTDIVVYRNDGKFLPGWPKSITTSCSLQQGPAVDDLNADGSKEVIVGDNCGYLHVLDRNGNYLSGWPKQISGTYLNAPSVSDINGDGVKDIIVGDWASVLHVVEPDGSELKGWPQVLKYGPEPYYYNMIYNGTSVGDLDRDGKEEIAVVGMACLQSSGCAPVEGERVDKLWILRSDGSTFLGPISYPGGVLGGPILADVDLDGFLDIILNTYSGQINAIDRFGNSLKGWGSKPINTVAISSVAVGDLDLDGKVEIAMASYNPTTYDTCLYVYKADATVMPGWPICFFSSGISFNVWGVNITFGNLDSDSQQEISINNFQSAGNGLFQIYAFNPDGSTVENFGKVMNDTVLDDTMPIADLDNDGDNELIAHTWSGLLYIWDLSGKAGADPWPVYQHDERHSGNLNNLVKPVPAPASGAKRR